MYWKMGLVAVAAFLAGTMFNGGGQGPYDRVMDELTPAWDRVELGVFQPYEGCGNAGGVAYKVSRNHSDKTESGLACVQGSKVVLH